MHFFFKEKVYLPPLPLDVSGRVRAAFWTQTRHHRRSGDLEALQSFMDTKVQVFLNWSVLTKLWTSALRYLVFYCGINLHFDIVSFHICLHRQPKLNRNGGDFKYPHFFVSFSSAAFLYINLCIHISQIPGLLPYKFNEVDPCHEAASCHRLGPTYLISPRYIAVKFQRIFLCVPLSY